MRALVVRPGPQFAVSDVARGWVNGLRALGVKVLDFNFDDRLNFYDFAYVKRNDEFVKAFETADDVVRLAVKGLGATCYEWWPDLVLMVYGRYMPADYYEVLRSRGHKVVLIHTESPYEDEHQVETAGLVDVNIVNDPTNLDRFRAVNPHTFYLPHAYDPALHRPDGPKADPHDVVIVGTGFRRRLDILAAADWTGIDLALGGNWFAPMLKYVVHEPGSCIDNADAVRLYRAAKSSVNIYRETGGWSMGPREVELAAVGCFYLTEAREENRQVLPMVPTFDGDLEDRLRYYLAHDDKRERIAEKARAAIAPRTFENNARRLLEVL